MCFVFLDTHGCFSNFRLVTGAHGLIIVDLGTGESWRHLDQLGPVNPTSHFLPVLFGTPTYQSSKSHPAFHWETVAGGGVDGA